MGMYTEIYVNADLKEETPQEIIDVLSRICSADLNWFESSNHPSRWAQLFRSGSYYTPNTFASNLTYDEIGKQYSIIGKGDIKNYNDEIEKFFEFIKPWCENSFVGYFRYEESESPTLVFK